VAFGCLLEVARLPFTAFVPPHDPVRLAVVVFCDGYMLQVPRPKEIALLVRSAPMTAYFPAFSTGTEGIASPTLPRP
jgi:hypothetical protein